MAAYDPVLLYLSLIHHRIRVDEVHTHVMCDNKRNQRVAVWATVLAAPFIWLAIMESSRAVTNIIPFTALVIMGGNAWYRFSFRDFPGQDEANLLFRLLMLVGYLFSLTTVAIGTIVATNLLMMVAVVPIYTCFVSAFILYDALDRNAACAAKK